MVLLLDTAEHDAAERADAVRAVVEQMSVPTEVALLGAARANTRMHVWQLGELSALRNEGRPIRLLRTPKHVRRDAPEVVSLNVQLRGRCSHHQEGHIQTAGRGELMMADLSGAYESDTGVATLACYIPYSMLGVEVDVGRRAMSRLGHSPVHAVVSRHLVNVERDIDRLASGVAAHAVGEATVQLVRALLLSAADDPRRRDALHEALRLRVMDYIRRNLHDSELGPQRIARDHHVSVRTLYNLWPVDEAPIMEWIVRERLDRARIELSRPDRVGPVVPVAAIALRWGFRDPGHFSRRFRERFGVTPGEWRRRGSTGIRPGRP